MKIFIDSDAFIALLNKNDALHLRAVEVLSKIENHQELELYTAWDVIDEVATKTSYYISKKQAKDFLKYIESIKTNIVYPTPELSSLARQMFNSIKSKNVSMTDCMNCVIVKQLKIDYIFSFDKDYQKQGLILLPSKY